MPAKSRISCIFTVHLQLHPGRAGQTPEGGIRPVYVELAEWSIVMDSGDTSFRRSDFAPSTMIAGSIEQLVFPISLDSITTKTKKSAFLIILPFHDSSATHSGSKGSNIDRRL